MDEKNILFLLHNSIIIFVLKSTGFCKLSHSSEMQNDALMHSSKGLTQFNTINVLVMFLYLLCLI